ncbi:MAG: glycosyltransferase family 2 protein [Lachnospiraceae bacterium]|nr:glycosyltransferase family 2 protein [Lachnospiraceae bacterium]
MRASVVIPNYNGLKFLPTCLASLALQTVTDFEVIVVDNGSTDGSLEYLSKHPEVKVIAFPENTGFCKAVNEGIKASNAEYVILLNNDTKAYNTYVEYLLKAIEKDEQIFSVNPQMLSMDYPGRIDDAGDLYCALGWAFARGKGKRKELYDTPKEIFASCGGASIYRRKIFDEIGLFDETHFAYLEDLDVGYRALIHGYKNLYYPDAKVLHVGSGASGSRYNEFKVRLSSANSVYVIGKNMPLLQWVINLPFLFIGFNIKILFFIRRGLGGTYFKGLFRGMGMVLKHYDKHVPFRFRHMKNYLRIQVMLWVNMVLRLKG